MSNYRQPSLYISHGGGPCFWIDMPEPIGKHGFDKLRQYLAGVLASLSERPKAILVVSAHWEEKVPTVSTAAMPAMLFDYHGFPEHTYHLNYSAPGSPEIARRVQSLLMEADIETAADNMRGFDHGVFVPFLILDPAARIPVVMLSLRKDLDPALHLAIGAALVPLRDEGILIVGSGSSYHNLQGFFDSKVDSAAPFDQWLAQTLTDPDIHKRNTNLIDWESAPSARAAHPREEHLLPLMVAAGAGGMSRGRHSFNDVIGGKLISCFSFDETVLPDTIAQEIA